MEACLVAAAILQRWRADALPAGLPQISAKFSLRPHGGLTMTWRCVEETATVDREDPAVPGGPK